MENLVVNHIYLTLGIAGLVSMILTGCEIQTGDVLYKRFQRKALERSLTKVAKLVAVILISFSLLTSQMAFGQQTPPAPKVTRTEQYHKLLAVTHSLMVGLKRVCKTEECAGISEEGMALVTDAQPKATKDWTNEPERQDFHDKLQSVLTRTISAIQTRHEQAGNVKVPECPACQTKNVVFDGDRCDLCYETFEQVAEICALYLGTCETCALICLSWAALNFGNCLKRFCDNG